MTKHTGLSRLAEAASPITHYPVKRRGERRHLLPNWDAIAWLEEETADATRIVERIDVYTDRDYTGTQWTVARGWSTAKRNGQYARPMYELFNLEASSTTMRIYTDPCPACLDFSRSWACEEHPEVPWDDKKKQWDRTSTDPYAPPLPSPGFTLRQADQLAAEWERQHGTPLADVLAQMNRNWNAELGQSFFRNATLEVNGETVDGVLSFSFEVEGDAARDS